MSVARTPHEATACLPGFLPLGEAAQWAGVSTRTFHRWIDRGLPVYRAGPRSKVLVRPGDLERFLTRHQTPQPDLNALVDEVMASMTKKKLA